MKTTTQKIIFSSMLAALVCVVTMVIKIPSPLSGYLNPGDCIVLLSGWLMPPLYGFLAAAVGSALADIFSGYMIYAPVTFLIKGIMALLASLGYSLLRKKAGGTVSHVLSGITAELFMILGYFAFEGILYGFAAAALNIPINALQGAVGLVLGILLTGIFRKHKIL
ncbi:MAG: ECF transporter S component [Clostridia bacterium]|nr:ECF transporter S component [Clostridia bacterium]